MCACVNECMYVYNIMYALGQCMWGEGGGGEGGGMQVVGGCFKRVISRRIDLRGGNRAAFIVTPTADVVKQRGVGGGVCVQGR